MAGRMVSYRLMGKAGFAHLQGNGKRLQIYVRKDAVGEAGFALFHLLDLGDSIGVRGHLFRTKTNELSVWVEQLTFLSKAFLPLPEKWHGLADVEIRYRQRYLDLIANEKAREAVSYTHLEDARCRRSSRPCRKCATCSPNNRVYSRSKACKAPWPARHFWISTCSAEDCCSSGASQPVGPAETKGMIWSCVRQTAAIVAAEHSLAKPEMQ